MALLNLYTLIIQCPLLLGKDQMNYSTLLLFWRLNDIDEWTFLKTFVKLSMVTVLNKKKAALVPTKDTKFQRSI